MLNRLACDFFFKATNMFNKKPISILEVLAEYTCGT